MAYKYQYNPGIQDNLSLKSTKSNGRTRSNAGTLKRHEVVRHRKHEDSDGGLSCGASCCLGFLVLLTQILLNGVMALVLYWVMRFHSKTIDGTEYYFAWKGAKNYDVKLGFNYHPVLMIAGFIYFAGQAMLMYRSCRCCRRIWNKLLHALFHLLAAPCIAMGFIAVLDSHNERTTVNVNQEIVPAPIPNFYSLHSWMGLATMGLFGLQYVAGFFSFLLLLCCESATASFRAAMVPIHSTFGISTFVMAIATCCSGLTEKVFFTLSIAYSKWVPYAFDREFNASTALAGLETLGPEYKHDLFHQSLVVNALGLGLIVLGVVMSLLVAHPRFRNRPSSVTTITVAHDRYG